MRFGTGKTFLTLALLAGYFSVHADDGSGPTITTEPVVYATANRPPDPPPPVPGFILGLGASPSVGGASGGGGSDNVANNTAHTADPKKSKQPGCNFGGDPVDLSTGIKVEMATDFALPGEMGLAFRRYYVSRNVHGAPSGGGWTDNLDFEIHAECLAGVQNDCSTAVFMRPDGSQIAFSQPAPSAFGASMAGPFSEVGGGGNATLTYTSSGSGAPGTYTLVDEDNSVYTWLENAGASSGMNGVLSSITDASGIGWAITHPSANVAVVTHTSGRVMTLTTSTVSTSDGNASVLTVTDPAGTNYIYQAKAKNTFSWSYIPLMLETAQLPGSTPVTIKYSYAPFDPNATIKLPVGLVEVDYNGVPHDLTQYDTQGNTTLTEMADGTQKAAMSYATNSTGILVTLTNSASHQSTYQFDANGDLVTITGLPSAHCASTVSPSTYDTNGYLQTQADNNGNVTHYSYLPTGQLQTLVEAQGLPEQRTSTSVWDTGAGFNRILSRTIAGLEKISYAYNDKNRLDSFSITNLSGNGIPNQVLATSYNYVLYPNGMVHVMSVIHPSSNNSNTDTYTYDALGNLESVANGLGHTISYTSYNALGLPGHVTGPNGDTTDYAYDARGLVTSKTIHPNGVAAITSYTYDVFGQLATQSQPDGEVTTWSRDPYGMLKTITRNDKDGTSTETFGYDSLGDLTSDVVARGSDIGISLSAIYDELGRIYQKIGNHNQVTSYAYDLNGNVHSITNAVGHSVTYTYDGLNRVKTITEQGGASPSPPSAVPTLTLPASNVTGSYTVSWSSVTNAASYVLQEQVGSGSWTTVQATSATSWSVSGKVNGTYSYRVQACNVAGCGAESAVATTTVAIPPPPAGAPSLSVPNASFSGSFGVTWTAVSGASTYQLQESVNGGGWSQVQNTGATTWTTSGRANGTYSYEVRACNSTGCGPFSAAGTIVVTLPPASAPTISAPTTNGSGSYTISWTGITGTTSYVLNEQVNGGAWSTVQSGGALSWSTSGRAAGSYSYQVQACNAAGCSAWSAVSAVIVSVPIAANGQAYSYINNLQTTGAGSANISFNIVSGNTWQVMHVLSGIGHFHAVQASGAVPAAAVSVQITYTNLGPPAGYGDAGGAVTNAASSPTALSSSPASEYDTAGWTTASGYRGRAYQVKVDFFNAIGVDISSSTFTLTAGTEPTP